MSIAVRGVFEAIREISELMRGVRFERGREGREGCGGGEGGRWFSRAMRAWAWVREEGVDGGSMSWGG